MYQEGWLLRIGFQLRAVALLVPVRCVVCFFARSLALSWRRVPAFVFFVVFAVHYSWALLFYY